MSTQRSLYAMVAITLVLCAVSVWSVTQSNDATKAATALAADLRVLQERSVGARTLQLAACERANAIRRRVDSYAVISRAFADEFSRWLLTSAEFRREQGDLSGAAESRAARRRILDIAKLVTPIGEVDCTAVIP